MSNYPDDYTLSEAIRENRAAEDQARFELLWDLEVEAIEDGLRNEQLAEFVLDADSDMPKHKMIEALGKQLAQEEYAKELRDEAH